MANKRTVARDRQRFLQPGASTAELIRAAVRNHCEWFAARAVHSGGEVRREQGVTRMITPSEVTIAFPRIKATTADSILYEIVEDCRHRKPNIVGVWAVTPTRPRDLGVRLLTRGFSWGWQPHWMAMDFRNIPSDATVPYSSDTISKADRPPPQDAGGADNRKGTPADGAGSQYVIVSSLRDKGDRHQKQDAGILTVGCEEVCDWDVEQLPYYDRAGAPAFRSLVHALPQRAFHFAARIDGSIAGHSIMFLTAGALGVAGIYNVGVLPEHRRRGVGKALMYASCEVARSLGCHYALLNSAASDFYSSIGFESLGWGQTWWMHRKAIEAPAPAPGTVAFITAMGRGNLHALEYMERDLLPRDLDAPLPNGMMPIEVALRLSQPAVVNWLMEKGATLDIRYAWDLGWKDRIAALVVRKPELINRRLGDWNTTPLHEAVSRGDVEFVRTLLAHNPDLNIQDTEFHSTPLGWARHFAQNEIIGLIEAHMRRVNLEGL